MFFGSFLTLLSAAFFTHVPDPLSKPVSTLLKLPEARQVLEEAQKEGPIALNFAPLGSHASNAQWEVDTRTITLNSSKRTSEGRKVCSILFELHNAISDKQFCYYDELAKKGRISRQEYIDNIEWIEYQNALKTCTLVDKAVSKGLFPSDARWPIARNFEEHLYIQKHCGHSEHIGKLYDSFTRFHYFATTLSFQSPDDNILLVS